MARASREAPQGRSSPTWRTRGEALRVSKEALAEHLKGGGKLSVALMRSVEIADQNGMLVSVVTYAEAAEADDHRP
jgi:hypothetical protein